MKAPGKKVMRPKWEGDEIGRDMQRSGLPKNQREKS